MDLGFIFLWSPAVHARARMDMAADRETYLTDPSQEPDMSKWVTQLAFKLAD